VIQCRFHLQRSARTDRTSQELLRLSTFSFHFKANCLLGSTSTNETAKPCRFCAESHFFQFRRKRHFGCFNPQTSSARSSDCDLVPIGNVPTFSSHFPFFGSVPHRVILSSLLLRTIRTLCNPLRTPRRRPTLDYSCATLNGGVPLCPNSASTLAPGVWPQRVQRQGFDIDVNAMISQTNPHKPQLKSVIKQ
jgi:hypothetical protein